MRTSLLSGAALGAALAACGNATDHLADAPPGIDAPAFDAGPDASLPGTLNVTTLDYVNNNAPEPGLSVVIYNPDNSVVFDNVSDAAGHVTAQINPGAKVMTVYPNGSFVEVIIVEDVVPGDLTIGFQNNDSSSKGTVAVTFPANPNATSYTLYGPCGAQSATAGEVNQLAFRGNCNPDPFDVYVVASTMSGAYQWASLDGVARNSTTVAIPGFWQYLTYPQAGYTNLPPNLQSIDATRLQGLNGWQTNGNVTVPLGAPSAGFQFGGATPLAASFALVASDFQRAPPMDGSGSGSGSGSADPAAPLPAFAQQEVFQHISAGTTTYNLSVSENLLPWIQTMAYDRTTQTIAATVDPTSSTHAYDAAVFFIDFNDTVSGKEIEYATFGQPKLSTSFPVPPDHLHLGLPKPTDAVQGEMILLDADDHDGWRDVRTNPLSFFGLVEEGNASATARYDVGEVQFPAPAKR